MDNNYSPQMPPVNNSSTPQTPSSYAPVPPIKPASRSSSDTSLIKTVIIILLSLLFIAALLLAYYFFREYSVASSNVEQQVDAAVSAQAIEIETNLRTEYDEKEKEPYDTFTGPSDYGTLSFKYPKTWSVYVEDDASSGKDFSAFFHPDEVPPIKDENPIALEVTISTQAYDAYLGRFNDGIKRGDLKSTVIKINGEDATRIEGKFSENETGAIVVIKIRDKVAVLETEATIYLDDFNKIIETVTFNQ